MADLQKFIRMVARMRAAQKLHAKTHTKSAAAAAARLEYVVDGLLDELGFMSGQASKQLTFGGRSEKSTETPGVYNVGDAYEKESSGGEG